jgi:hypothetical protein
MSSIIRYLTIAAFSALPLIAQPFPLGTPPVGPTFGDVTGAGGASNGKFHLVAWSETRAGIAQVRGIHVSFDGVVIEPESFRISAPGEVVVDGDQSAPAVATDGTNFVVVWAARSRLHLAFFPASGAPRVVTTDIDARSASIVWTGLSYIVISETSVPGVLAATALNFDASVIRDSVSITKSRSVIFSPSLAVNRSGRAIAFWLDAEDNDAHFADVSLDRVLSGGIASESLESPRRVSFNGVIASDGDAFLAVWAVDPVDSTVNAFDILSRPLDASGATSGPVKTVASSAPRLIHPLLYWDGQRYLLVNSDPLSGVNAQKLNPDGTPQPGSPYLISIHSSSRKEGQVIVAGDVFGATKTFFLWCDFRFDHGELFGQYAGLDLVPASDDIIVSRSSANQHGEDAVFSGTDYLAVWTERAGVTRIVASRANERVPIVIAGPQLTASTPSFPAVAAGGSLGSGRAVIVWIDVAGKVPPQQTALYRAVLVNGAQTPSSPALITTDVSNDAPSIATNGASFAVAWTTRQGEIAATTIDAAGNISLTPVALTVKPSDTLAYSSPRLVWTGSSYVMARLRTMFDGRILVEVQRLSQSLTPDGAAVPLTDTATSSGLNVAGSPGFALVTWILHSSFNASVRAARVAGTVFTGPPPPQTTSDPINGITVFSGEPAHGPAAAWDGKAWRIGIDNVLATLPTTGGVQISFVIPTANRIAAVAGGGTRPLVMFDVDDPIERISRVFGLLVNEVVLRRHSSNPH